MAVAYPNDSDRFSRRLTLIRMFEQTRLVISHRIILGGTLVFVNYSAEILL